MRWHALVSTCQRCRDAKPTEYLGGVWNESKPAIPQSFRCCLFKQVALIILVHVFHDKVSWTR